MDGKAWNTSVEKFRRLLYVYTHTMGVSVPSHVEAGALQISLGIDAEGIQSTRYTCHICIYKILKTLCNVHTH